MVQIVWEFLVRADTVPEFERYYASDGPWARLFRKSPGFRGTVLLRDLENRRRFLTIDSWETLAAQSAMREQFQDEYLALDRTCEEMTESERRVGVFWEWQGGESNRQDV